MWGRRRPFFYREQVGEKLLVDDGRERLETFPRGASGQPFAVRMPSRPLTTENRWVQFAEGTDWQDPRQRPWRIEGDTLIFRGVADAGMRGPGTVSYYYFFVDRRTWLPRRLEYRHVRGGVEFLNQALDLEYDAPFPADIAVPALPAGTRVIDASVAPRDVPSDTYTRSGGGITARMMPVKLDRQGNVLARLDAWLGPVRLGGEHEELGFGAGWPTWTRTAGREHHPWTTVDERGRPYLLVSDLETGDRRGRNMLGRQQILWFAPLEPLAGGAPLPRRLTAQVEVHADGPTMNPHGAGIVRMAFLGQDLEWSLPLPNRPARIVEADYRVPPAERHVHYSEDVPLPIRIAWDRARAYMNRSNRPNTVRWLRWAINHLPPDSNFAQFLRLDLASQHRRAHDRENHERVLREVLAVKQKHPKTWDYYANSARWELERLGAPRPPPAAGPR